MITETTGDLLSAGTDALVNTVNTVGVMGKGIALQFKKSYPEMFEAYRTAARSGALRLGKVHVWPTGQLTGPRYIINFPTKGHWKSRSTLNDIHTGLNDLVDRVKALKITSIAIPPLGCGNGGLAWTDVRPEIIAAFATLSEVDVLLFEPDASPAATALRATSDRPAMVAIQVLVDLGQAGSGASAWGIQGPVPLKRRVRAWMRVCPKALAVAR